MKIAVYLLQYLFLFRRQLQCMGTADGADGDPSLLQEIFSAQRVGYMYQRIHPLQFGLYPAYVLLAAFIIHMVAEPYQYLGVEIPGDGRHARGAHLHRSHRIGGMGIIELQPAARCNGELGPDLLHIAGGILVIDQPVGCQQRLQDLRRDDPFVRRRAFVQSQGNITGKREQLIKALQQRTIRPRLYWQSAP